MLPTGEGDIAKLAAKLAERDAEAFNRYTYVLQSNLAINDMDKQIGEWRELWRSYAGILGIYWASLGA